jgi:hypothetical protein
MLTIYVRTWISVKKWHFYGLIKKDLKSVSLDKLYICSTKIWFSQLEIAPIFSLNYAPCYHWVKYHFIVLSVWKKITQDPRSYAAHASRRPPPVGWTRTSAPCSLHERPSREESHTPGESCHPSVSSLQRSPNPHRICRAFALAPSVFVHPEILQEEVTTRWAFPLCLPMSRHYFCASRPLPGGGASVVGAVGRIVGSLIQLVATSIDELLELCIPRSSWLSLSYPFLDSVRSRSGDHNSYEFPSFEVQGKLHSMCFVLHLIFACLSIHLLFLVLKIQIKYFQHLE